MGKSVGRCACGLHVLLACLYYLGIQKRTTCRIGKPQCYLSPDHPNLTLLASGNCKSSISNSRMFGLRLRGSSGIVSDIALRLRQNLSLRGVRVQYINIGGGVGGEIPDNKRLEYALQHIHGIGHSKAHHIVCELGVENKYVKDLSKRELYSLRELLSKYLIGNDLKKCVQRDVGRLVSIQCYRGIRHVDGLPCRGQRTHTNARTRKSRPTFAGSR